MAPVVEITSVYQKWLMYIGCIGSMISLLTAIILLSHVVFHFFKIFYRQHADQPKLGYYILFLFFIGSIITSLSNLLINTNIFTHVTIKSFNIHQCSISYLLFYISTSITITALYIMLLYRIKIIFKGSIFEYKKYIFKIFYFIIFIDILLFIGDKMFRFIEIIQFDLLYEPQIGLIECHANHISDRINVQYTLIFTMTMHIFLSASFLLMFICRLNLLNKGMIQRFLSEYCKDSQRISASGSGSKSFTVSTVIGEFRHSIKHKQRVMSDSVFRIIELNDLSKKHSILVFIVIISSLIFWSLIGFFNRYYIQQFGWYCTMNSICVWFMSGVSKKYWLCCRKYGICMCCYSNINKISPHLMMVGSQSNRVNSSIVFTRKNTHRIVNDTIEIMESKKQKIVQNKSENGLQTNDKLTVNPSDLDLNLNCFPIVTQSSDCLSIATNTHTNVSIPHINTSNNITISSPISGFNISSIANNFEQSQEHSGDFTTLENILDDVINHDCEWKKGENEWETDVIVVIAEESINENVNENDNDIQVKYNDNNKESDEEVP